MWPIYRHYKGKHYLGIVCALHSESEEPLQIYRALYDNTMTQTWARPLPMFQDSNAQGVSRFTPVGNVRRAFDADMQELLSFGYDAWGEGRSLQEFVASYQIDPKLRRGEWYVLELPDGTLCAKLKVLRFSRGILGIASLSTRPSMRGGGYAALITRAVMEACRLEDPHAHFILFSEARTALFERQGFYVLPEELQHFPPSVAMATHGIALDDTVRRLVSEYF